MIVKKIFYQVTKDSDWEVGIVFKSDLDKERIITKQGFIFGIDTFYDTREPVNEHIGISI